MAVEIGALRALLSLDSAAFESGAKRAQASMNTLQRGLTRASERMRRVGRTLSTRVTAPLAAMGAVALRSSLQTIDAQSKMAQSLDTSTRSMQVLARAADRAGLSTGELEQIGRQLTRRLSQAAAGAGPAAEALEQLGLSAEDLTTLDLDERIAAVNAAIEENVPASQRAAVAAKIFGDRAGLLATRLDAGVIRQASDEIERFGLAVTELEADQIEEANDAISALGLVSRGLANQLAVALAPTLKTIAERIADVGAWFANLSPDMQRLVGISASLAAAVGPLAIALGFMATGLAALASPIGVVVFGLGALAGAAVYVATRWDDLVERFPVLGTVAERVAGAVRVAWDGIKASLTAVADAIGSAIEGVTSLIDGDLTGAVTAFRDAVSSLGEGVRASINTVLAIIGELLPGFSEIVDSITATLEALPAKVAQIGRDVISGFRDGIVQRWQEVKEAVLGIFRLGDVDAGGAGRKLGADLSSGIALGVSQNRAAGEAEIRDYLGGLEDAARKESETNSPSRVFMRIGQDLMSGLSMGIGQNASQAAEAAGEAAKGVSDTVEQSTSMLDSFKGSVKTVFRDILTGARSFEDSVTSVLSSLSNRLIDFGLDMALSGLFPGQFQQPSVPSFGGFRATGGSVAAGAAYVVGERGPELFVPGKSGTIVPNGAGGGVTVNVNNYTGAEVQARRGPGGRVDIEVREAVSGVLASGGADRAMRQRFGVTPRARGG